MSHRGPDDQGAYVDPRRGVALGARRLSIIDVKGGHQPLSNEDGTVWAALNGEIYNHPVLQARLRSGGHSLASASDTEVLVHLYEDYGTDMVHMLEGMFAFAVWDARRERLLLGRDRFGEKPLFYADRAGDLAFASELTALLAAGGTHALLDRTAVDEFFVFGYVPGERSIVRDVRQLLPGHTLTWERGASPTLECYWRPPRVAVECAESRTELVEETERLLDESVGSRMIADVPLGVFLSGGVDSTLIAALAARRSTTPIKTFTVGYDTGSVSELDSARQTANALGTEHLELVLSEAEVVGKLPDVVGGLDQPLADQALLPLYAVAEFARREVTVAIGGEGADELFGGYPRYRWLGRQIPFGGVVPASVARLRPAGLRTHGRLERASKLAELLSRQSLAEKNLDWVTARRRHIRTRIYGPAMHRAADAGAALASFSSALEERNGSSVERQLMLLDQRHWLPDDVLMKSDRAGMQVSLEIRAPFLHRELAEFANSVADDQHLRPVGKSLLRDLLDSLLPTGAGRRSKTAFRVPASEWLRGPVAPLLSEQLESGALYREGWFDQRQVASLFVAHRAGQKDFSSVLWPLLTLGIWLDGFRARVGGGG